MMRRVVLMMLGALSVVCGVLQTGAGAQELRDPFTFGASGSTVEHPAQPTLIGVLWDVRQPLAMIGDDTVGVGDTIAGWNVIDIQQDGVTLQRDGRSVVLIPGTPLPPD